MVRKKKIGREEPDGLCSCLLISCKSFLPSQSHTSFSLLLLRLAQCESVRETDLSTDSGRGGKREKRVRSPLGDIFTEPIGVG